VAEKTHRGQKSKTGSWNKQQVKKSSGASRRNEGGGHELLDSSSLPLPQPKNKESMKMAQKIVITIESIDNNSNRVKCECFCNEQFISTLGISLPQAIYATAEKTSKQHDPKEQEYILLSTMEKLFSDFEKRAKQLYDSVASITSPEGDVWIKHYLFNNSNSGKEQSHEAK
jgi:hypothetical protein